MNKSQMARSRWSKPNLFGANKMFFKKGQKTTPVKTHLTEEEFDEFMRNLSEDGLNRSEWIRQEIKQYNIRKRARRESQNVISIFDHS